MASAQLHGSQHGCMPRTSSSSLSCLSWYQNVHPEPQCRQQCQEDELRHMQEQQVHEQVPPEHQGLKQHEEELHQLSKHLVKQQVL